MGGTLALAFVQNTELTAKIEHRLFPSDLLNQSLCKD